MPTYEYACTSCGHHLEAHQSFSDEPLATCPECRGSLRKVFGSVGIVLKGSGFYRTDSRNGSGASRSKDAGAGKAAASSGDSASSSNGSSSGSSGSGDSASSTTSGSSTSSGSSSSSGNGSGSSAAKTAAS
jgi:putative FmdB family regulatory protein